MRRSEFQFLATVHCRGWPPPEVLQSVASGPRTEELHLPVLPAFIGLGAFRTPRAREVLRYTLERRRTD